MSWEILNISAFTHLYVYLELAILLDVLYTYKFIIHSYIWCSRCIRCIIQFDCYDCSTMMLQPFKYRNLFHKNKLVQKWCISNLLYALSFSYVSQIIYSLYMFRMARRVTSMRFHFILHHICECAKLINKRNRHLRNIWANQQYVWYVLFL